MKNHALYGKGMTYLAEDSHKISCFIFTEKNKNKVLSAQVIIGALTVKTPQITEH